jgi:fibronectin type 3 domain-containing protein
MMLRSLLLLAAALFSCGCGYIGEPLPPALHIPERVTDLSASQQGARIVAQFTLPSHTTENLDLSKPVRIELRVGPAGTPSQTEAWEAAAKLLDDIPTDHPSVKYSLSGTEWIGRDVVIGVKIFSDKGRTAGWSNMVTLSVVEPLAPPVNLQVKAVADGVRIAWSGSSPHYRIYRRAGQDASASPIHEIDGTEYTDPGAQYGTTYYYSVEAYRTGGDIHATSERSAEVEITPEDKFPPPVPTGLAAVVSTGSIEVVWEPGAAPDLAGYRIYRAVDAGPLEKLAETRDAPSYSDAKIEPGKSYRYAVTAFDKTGNESPMSVPVTATVH